MSQNSTPLQRLEAELKQGRAYRESLRRGGSRRARTAASNAVSPYPGLRPFHEDESRFFRGRDSQVAEIGERLARKRCVTVLGGSGSGKSSIVRAGVIPALRRKLIPERGDFWRAAIFAPGLNPIDELVKEFEGILAAGYNEATHSADQLRAQRRAQIREVLYQEGRLGALLPIFREELDVEPTISALAREQANLLIVIDQFEELFRDENRGKVQVASIVDLIVGFWRDPVTSPGLYLAITMRTDDLHRCAEFIDLPDFINATSYLTRRLREREIREVIVAPVYAPLVRSGLIEGELPPGEVDLRPYGVDVVTELLDAVAEIGHDPDHLPLLQHLLAVLWRYVLTRWHREDEAGTLAPQPRITLEDLAGTLGFQSWTELTTNRSLARGDSASGWLLRECVNRVADSLLKGGPFGNALTEPQRQIARIAFCLMGEVDDRGNVKRRFTNKKEIASVASLDAPNADVDAVLRRFSQDHRLIWVRESGEIDVSHEALMRNWRRLADWLSKDRIAGQAYLQLSQRYQHWQATIANWPRWMQFWVSWLKRKDGLLRGDTLDRLDSVLTEKHSRFGRAEPLYNHYWARRYLQASDGGDGAEDTSPRALASQRDVVEHRERFRYLLLSMRHNVFFQSLPALTIVLFVALMGGGLYIQQIQENRRLERIVTAGQLQASGLWDKLSGWTPTPGPDYVDVLWEIRAASPEVRKEFVAQSRLNPNIQAIGLRPQPIVRAVGLLWPEQARQTISDSVTLALEDPKNAAGWQTSSLACASAVLNERLNKACMDRAVAHAKKDILQGDWTTTQDLWSNGRILACMGPWFDSETQNTAIKHIFSSEKIQDSTPNDWEVGAAALAVNSGAWLVQTQQRALTLDELGVINKIVGAVIDALAKKPSDEWASTRARYLASLIAVLPLEDQRAALKRIIAVVATLPAKDDATTELLLVLAQVSELVAEHHRKQGAADMLRPLISEAWNRVKSSPLEDPAVSRLILPLVEVAGANGEVRAGIHGLIDPPNPGNAALVGLWGRHLAVWPVPKGVDRGHEIADKVETAVNLLEAVDKQVTAPTDRWLAGEGLARGIAALAKPADLNANAREHALDAAKVALAQTASPEESAAWANAIGSLISTFDKPEQVSTIVEVMKYPNAGLTAREPNAREPQNASDILIRLLVNLVDPKRGEFDWKPGYQIKELRRLLEDGLLKGLDLESAPQDPRPRGPKHNS